MEVLEIGGKSYIKASQAAKKAGYTSDYVGQLCRSGAISAQLIGRSWYVDESELLAHKVEKKRSSRVKAREQVKKTLQEKRSTTHAVSVTRASYQSDERELMPNIKKSSQRDQLVGVTEVPVHVSVSEVKKKIVKKETLEHPVAKKANSHQVAVSESTQEKELQRVPLIPTNRRQHIQFSRTIALTVVLVSFVLSGLLVCTQTVWVVQQGILTTSFKVSTSDFQKKDFKYLTSWYNEIRNN